jgi:hypothetical protein
MVCVVSFFIFSKLLSCVVMTSCRLCVCIYYTIHLCRCFDSDLLLNSYTITHKPITCSISTYSIINPHIFFISFWLFYFIYMYFISQSNTYVFVLLLAVFGNGGVNWCLLFTSYLLLLLLSSLAQRSSVLTANMCAYCVRVIDVVFHDNQKKNLFFSYFSVLLFISNTLKLLNFFLFLFCIRSFIIG